MKNLYIALCIALASYNLSAQNAATKRADKLFKQYEYVSAAEEYLKLVEKGKGDSYVYKQLADTYYNMFNTAEAAKWYEKATEEKQDAETYFRYAQMLKASGRYEDANKQMKIFASEAPNDLRAKSFKENPNYLPKLIDKVTKYNVNPLDFNTDKSDFGALLHENEVYFTSARSGARRSYGWNKEPYLDIYKAEYKADGTVSNALAVKELNSKYHDGPSTLSADGNTIYFSSDSFRENSFEKDRENKLKLGRNNIFKATKVGDKWGYITSLPFNSKDYSTSNPSLSRDGKTLYFSSDMPGSLGGVDIWKVSINDDGSFGTPENLGSKVNTEGNESFPFISDDNKTLFFASNGRQGFGGLDIFQIDLSKNTDAVNLGKPVNSDKDDFAFTFNSEKQTGFLSSNRNGNDDIFKVNPICGVEAITLVTNAKTGEILTDAKVSILDEQRNIIATEMSNPKGEVTYKVECDKAYVLQVSKDGFESNTFSITKSRGPIFNVKAPLQPIDVIVTETEIILKPIYFEFNKANITSEGAFELDKLVQVMKNNENMVIFAKSHTDNRGSDKYNMSLSNRRAKSTVQYIISKGISPNRISGKGMGESEPKIDCGNDCTEEQHSVNRRSEFLIIKK